MAKSRSTPDLVYDLSLRVWNDEASLAPLHLIMRSVASVHHVKGSQILDTKGRVLGFAKSNFLVLDPTKVNSESQALLWLENKVAYYGDNINIFPTGSELVFWIAIFSASPKPMIAVPESTVRRVQQINARVLIENYSGPSGLEERQEAEWPAKAWYPDTPS